MELFPVERPSRGDGADNLEIEMMRAREMQVTEEEGAARRQARRGTAPLEQSKRRSRARQ